MEELKNLSMKDELAGLFDRRGFLSLGEGRIGHHTRERADCLILFADMDGLKAINVLPGSAGPRQAIRDEEGRTAGRTE